MKMAAKNFAKTRSEASYRDLMTVLKWNNLDFDFKRRDYSE